MLTTDPPDMNMMSSVARPFRRKVALWITIPGYGELAYTIRQGSVHYNFACIAGPRYSEEDPDSGTTAVALTLRNWFGVIAL